MANLHFPSRSASSDVTFISWNVKSLNHPVECKKVLSRLEKLNVGIAHLQETHLRTFDHFGGGWPLHNCSRQARNRQFMGHTHTLIFICFFRQETPSISE